MTIKNKKIIISLLVIVTICLSFLPIVDKISYENNDKLLKRSVATFAVAKGLNGVISVLQGTEIGGSVIFANATFSVGEILDPLNDMVERFSWVMLASSIALGIEKILIQIGGTLSLKYVLCGFGVFFIASIWVDRLSFVKNLALKVFLILTLVRFVMPLAEIANLQIYSYFTKPIYKNAQTSLDKTKKILDNVNENISRSKKDKSFLNSLSDTFDLEKRFQNLKAKINTSYENMVSLMIVFILQTILFPLLVLFLCYKIIGFLLVKDRILD